MDIRRERRWCDDCTAPLIPLDQVPLIQLFLDALPCWRVGGGMVPVLMEGFDRGELAVLIAHRDLSESPVEAMSAMLDMEREYREIRAAKTKTLPSAHGVPGLSGYQFDQ
jgi:hypothetical protein